MSDFYTKSTFLGEIKERDAEFEGKVKKSDHIFLYFTGISLKKSVLFPLLCVENMVRVHDCPRYMKYLGIHEGQLVRYIYIYIYKYIYI